MTEGQEAAVHAVATQWRDVILAKDWTTFTRLYTRDAVLMPPNAPLVIGSAATAAWFANSGLMLQAFTARPEAIEGEEALAIVRSSYAMIFTVPGSAALLTEYGKSLLGVRRDEDGAWRIAIDIWNADGPPAPYVPWWSRTATPARLV